MTTQTEPLMIATIRIEGVTPLLFGGMIDRNAFPKKSRESHDDYERRTWRERAHASPDGRLYVPALALKRMFESTARQQDLDLEDENGASGRVRHGSGPSHAEERGHRALEVGARRRKAGWREEGPKGLSDRG